MHINRKTVLCLLLTSAFLLGTLISPVAALQANMTEESFNYAFGPGTNNHTYVYVPSNQPYLASGSSMYLNEDVDLTSYIYESSGWSSPDNSYAEGTNMYYDWQQFQTLSTGVYGNAPYLPDFYDFVGSDGSGAVINTTIERRSFNLAFGQTTPVVMDTDYQYFGTLTIGSQEFVYLNIASLSDGLSWSVAVYDPQNRWMGSVSSSNGDIQVLPFHPSGAGTYIVILYVFSSTYDFAIFNLKPEAVTPTTIPAGQVITGNLPTGEFVVSKDTGSIVGKQLAPTAHTYKINPKKDVSSLTYAFSYPTAPLGTTQPVSISFTSDAFVHGTNMGYRYQTSSSHPGTDVYYCRGGVYYITVMGGDNTGFTLYHKANVATNLPTNHKFMINNIFGHTDSMIYSLHVAEDSIIKVNSTSPSDFAINAWATYDDGYRTAITLNDGNTLDTSSHYYLRAGDYVVKVDVSADTSEWIQFSMAPLTTATLDSIVNVGGFIVPTDPCQVYNLTLTLNNLYNVSVPMDISIYDEFYRSMASTSLLLGTWFDGSTQIPHATQESEVELTLGSRMWSEDHAVILISTYPYNNTAGIGNDFQDFNVSLTINWEKVTENQYNNTASDGVPLINAATSSAGYNLTLGFPGIPNESYLLILNLTPGVWYNISIITADVSNLQNIYGYSPYYQSTYYLPWTDLNDEYQSSGGNYSVQFGAISDTMYLSVQVSRALIDTGFMWIEATPLKTHTFPAMEPLKAAGPNILAALGGVAVPLSVAAIVIVVVVVVYVKKFKK